MIDKKEWYQKNKEQVILRSKQWAKSNPDKIVAIGKRYYKIHKEKINNYAKEWRKNNLDKSHAIEKKFRQSHPEYTRHRRKEYYHDHSERAVACAKKWAKNNPEKAKNSREQYAKKHPEVIPIRVSPRYAQWRSDVYKRDNWTYLTCGTKKLLKAHHSKKGFTQIIKEHNIKNYSEALKCKELWDLNNGATLYKKCHELAHKKGK